MDTIRSFIVGFLGALVVTYVSISANPWKPGTMLLVALLLGGAMALDAANTGEDEGRPRAQESKRVDQRGFMSER